MEGEAAWQAISNLTGDTLLLESKHALASFVLSSTNLSDTLTKS